MDVVYARVAGRTPPAAANQKRRDRVLSIDKSGPEAALAKVQIAIGGACRAWAEKQGRENPAGQPAEQRASAPVRPGLLAAPFSFAHAVAPDQADLGLAHLCGVPCRVSGHECVNSPLSGFPRWRLPIADKTSTKGV